MHRSTPVTIWLLIINSGLWELAVTAPQRRPNEAYIKYLDVAKDILDRVPLIDGHNDFPITLHDYAKNQISNLDIYDLTNVPPWNTSLSSHTDIKRLRAGKVGAQFWSAYVGCSIQYKDAVQKTLEQIDVIQRMVNANPSVFEFVISAQGDGICKTKFNFKELINENVKLGIEDAFSRGKIGSLIGVEGGHSIGSSLATLRMMYSMGARYMTLTHSCPTPWGDNSQLDNPGAIPVHDGLSQFGEIVVREMNRLGMLVDLSHVSTNTMRDALTVSLAPVIFSHSSAYALCNNTRNVPDDVLQLVALNGGIVMVTFVPSFITTHPIATLQDVADHIDHIRRVAGIDYVGIGGDYNGVTSLPQGLEDTSTYPNLFAELIARGWTEPQLAKLAGGNLLRVFRGTEKVRDDMAARGVLPFDVWIPQSDVPEEALPCNSGDSLGRSSISSVDPAELYDE